MRTLFIGDLEAQYKICRYELENHLIPSVNEVVQLGNIISCSSAAKDKKELGRNEIALTFWDKVTVRKMQVMGVNEMAALNFPDEWTNNTSNNFLRDGWLTETPSIVTAFESKGRLVSHGGLTYGEWVEIGRPQNASEAAERLNEKYKNTLNQGSCFKTDGVPNLAANPIWADPVIELYPSWILSPEACPFDQVHGGDSLNTDRARAAVANIDHPLAHLDSVSYRKFGSLASVKETLFRAIDLNLTARLISSLPADKAFYVENS